MKRAKKHEGEHTPAPASKVEPVVTNQPPVAPVAKPVAADAPVAPKPAPVAAKKFRVKARAKVSFRGQMTTVQVGDIITEESYGPNAEGWLKEHKVDYEEVK